MADLCLPEPALVLLCGASASGKSTFAGRWFASTEIVSSDALRGTICDDEEAQDLNDEVFGLLHRIVDLRLAARRMTVVDATNLAAAARAPLLALARARRLPFVAIVLTGDADRMTERNLARGRVVPPSVLRAQLAMMADLPATLAAQGWESVHVLDEEESRSVVIRREPLPPMRFKERGPFDVVGDVHGCSAELRALMAELGYDADGLHPGGRRLVFVGDLVDRGPDSVGVPRLVLPIIEAGRALFVPGNHDDKLWRWLSGNPVKVSGGLSTTVAEWQNLSEREDRLLRERFDRLMSQSPPYLWLDGGQLLVSHAGLEAADHGRVGSAVRAFCLYGKTTGREVDGYPERLDWAADYRGKPAVVHGHVPTRRAEWRNGVADIDLGAVFGGALCAMRWPERTFVTIPAATSYWERGAAWAASGGVPT